MKVESLRASAYTVPTEEPEADGTLTWDRTTVVVAEAGGGGQTGVGFTYGPSACAAVIDDLLVDRVVGVDPMDVPRAWTAMVRAVRNAGRPGIASMAIAAVDVALWDLKARLLGSPLSVLLGRVRDAVPIYGSGGFTSMPDGPLEEQLRGWVEHDGMRAVKIKIGEARGSREARDLHRVDVARKAIEDRAELLVDANGGYGRKQAVRLARTLAAEGVVWFEEPVSSDDLAGLREIRGLVEMDVAAGEYGYDLPYFERMLAAEAVDCLQVDASRCAGISEWLRACGLAAARGIEVSSHTAQSLHVHAACAVPNIRHLEYFHDHARVDRMLFDGVLDPVDGELRPDPGRPGLGLELKRSEAERFRVR